MKAIALILAVAACAVSISAMAAGPVAGSLTLIGEDGAARTVSSQELAALPHLPASVAHDGKTESFKGALLSDLLKRVAAPAGKDLRGPALSDVVIVTASDGYTVALALSDLEPSIHPSKVLLADQDGDGAPLGAGQGPFRLVIDGDLKPARSARNVVRIEVRKLAKGSTAPKAR